MSSTLSEGVRVPDIGSVNWGADVNFNWGLLNTCLANISGNVKVNAENTWTAPQTFTETISGSIDGVAARAVGDEDGNNIKAALAGKQSSLSQSQLDACNSGVTAAAVQQIGTNASNISGLQTAVASKAADDQVVHLAGAETITGDKTHDAKLAITGNNLFAWERPQVTIGTLPSSNVYYGTTRYRDANTNSFVMERGSIDKNGTTDYGLVMYPWLSTSNSKGWSFYTSADGASAGFRPIGDNVDLGIASHKWKTLNGINPGALSLPDMGSYIDFSSSITNFDGTHNYYTPPVDGWMTVVTAGTELDLFEDNGQSDPRYQGSAISSTAVQGYCFCTIPVHKNIRVRIRVIGTSVYMAHVRPCLGNV